jgi:ABC-type antimicrobial peptide transport system permease subunit
MVGVGGTFVNVGGGFDVWLPLYIFLSFVLVHSVTGWYVTLRKTGVAVALGMFWSWSVNVISVIPAAAAAVLIACIAGMIVHRRARPTRGSD